MKTLQIYLLIAIFAAVSFVAVYLVVRDKRTTEPYVSPLEDKNFHSLPPLPGR